MWVISAILITLYYLINNITHENFYFEYTILCCEVIVSLTGRQEGLLIVIVVVLLCTSLTLISCIWLIVIAVRMSRQQGRPANLQGILTVIFIAVVYFASCLPVFWFYWMMAAGTTVTGHIESLCQCTPYLNSIANVFIYMISLKRFRNFVKAEVTAFCSCFAKKPTGIIRATSSRQETSTSIIRFSQRRAQTSV